MCQFGFSSWSTRGRFLLRNTSIPAPSAVSLFLHSSIMFAAVLKSLLFFMLVQGTERNLDAVAARRGEPRLVDSPALYCIWGIVCWNRAFACSDVVGPGSGSASHSSRISWKRLPMLLFHVLPASTHGASSTGLPQEDSRRISKGCHIEKPRGVVGGNVSDRALT